MSRAVISSQVLLATLFLVLLSGTIRSAIPLSDAALISADSSNLLDIRYFPELEPDFSNLVLKRISTNGSASNLEFSFVFVVPEEYALVLVSGKPLSDSDSISLEISDVRKNPDVKTTDGIAGPSGSNTTPPAPSKDPTPRNNSAANVTDIWIHTPAPGTVTPKPSVPKPSAEKPAASKPVVPKPTTPQTKPPVPVSSSNVSKTSNASAISIQNPKPETENPKKIPSLRQRPQTIQVGGKGNAAGVKTTFTKGNITKDDEDVRWGSLSSGRYNVTFTFNKTKETARQENLSQQTSNSTLTSSNDAASTSVSSTSVPILDEIVLDDALVNDSTIPAIRLTRLMTDETPFGTGAKKAFAIDPSAVDFTNGSFSAVARGKTLYKCAGWDFDARICQGVWVKVMDLTPGKGYTVELSPSDPAYAEYDSTLGAPLCANSVSPCIANETLLNYSGATMGGGEPNQPNTIDSCTDGTSNVNPTDEHIDAINVTGSGDNIIAGETVSVSVSINAFDTSDYLTIYYTNSTSQVVWREIKQIQAPGSGPALITTDVPLDPVGGQQAIRAVFAYGSALSSCGADINVYSDTDDVVFWVNPSIAFESPTPENNTNTINYTTRINITINETSLGRFTWNWNGTDYAIYDQDLVLMFNFDNLTALGESSDVANDQSWYRNNATLTSCIYDSDGKYGTAFNLDAVSSKISVPTHTALDGSVGTLSFWIKTAGIWGTSAGDMYHRAAVVARTDASASCSGFLLIQYPQSGGGQILAALYPASCGGATVAMVNNSADLTDDAYHHIALVFNQGSGKHQFLYVDGVLVDDQTSSGAWAFNSQATQFGVSPDSWWEKWNGTIDEVRWYNRSFSSAEVAQLYRSNLNRQTNETWQYYTSESGLVLGGAYTYQACANDTVADTNCTETRSLRYVNVSSCSNLSLPAAYELTADITGASVDAAPLSGYACLLLNNSNISLDCNGYNITNDISDITHGILFASGTTNVSAINCPNITNYSYGFTAYQSNATITNSTSHNNSLAGILALDANLSVNRSRLYANAEDLISNSTDSECTLNVSELVLEDPLGNYTNYTNLSFNDLASVGDIYSINYTTRPATLPHGYIKFLDKYLKFTKKSGSFVLDSATWNWLDSETTGFEEANLTLAAYSSSWSYPTQSLSVATHSITSSSLSEGTYGLLQNTPMTITYLSPTNDSYTNISYALVNVSVDQNVSSCSLHSGGVVDGGTGADGALAVTSGESVINSYAFVTNNVSAGATSIIVDSASGFTAGSEILIIQMQNGSAGIAGTYEFVKISSVDTLTLNLDSALTNDYHSMSDFNTTNATVTQVVSVPQYTTVSVSSGATLTASPWNGTIGGILVFRASTSVTIDGSMNVSEKGFRGNDSTAYQGESYLGVGAYNVQAANAGGGGGGYMPFSSWGDTPNGGGGSYITAGTSGGADYAAGAAGEKYGWSNLSIINLGSAGGSGGATGGGNPGRNGGSGGGIIMAYSPHVTSTGVILSHGGNGTDNGNSGCSGGGSGGAILITASTLTNSSPLSVSGGIGGVGDGWPAGNGGDGGAGAAVHSPGGGVTYAMTSVNADAATFAYYNVTSMSDGDVTFTTTCTGSLGNTNSSGDQVIHVDTVAPVISNVAASVGAAGTSATITWTTDHAANSTVFYGLSPTGLTSSESAVAWETSHSIALSSLTESRIYYYNVSSCDQAGNCAMSSTYNFSTDITPPTVLFIPPTPTTTITVDHAMINVSVSENVSSCLLRNSNDPPIYADAWADANCKYRKKLSFDNSAGSDELTDFPVLVRLNSSRINYSRVLSSSDVRFYSGSTLLPKETELWNASGDSLIWVKAPSIAKLSSTSYILAYYNCTDTSADDKTGVWSNGYVAVYHLNETSGTVYSSAPGLVNGTPSFDPASNQNAGGLVDGAVNFSASTDNIGLGDPASFTGMSGLTLEAWLKPTLTQANTAVMGWDADSGDAWQMIVYPNEYLYFRILTTVTSYSLQGSSATLTVGSWAYAAMTYDGATMTIYTNAIADAGTLSASGSIKRGYGTNAVLGRYYYGGYQFQGAVDEIRISNVTRSASWVNATYNSVNDTFVTYGAEDNGSISMTLVNNDADTFAYYNLTGLSLGTQVVNVSCTDLNSNSATNSTSFEYSGSSMCKQVTSSGTYLQTEEYVGAPYSSTTPAGVACVIITASDVVYDCQGYGIMNNVADTTFGILIASALTNLTIQNCPNVSNYTYGVYIYQSNATLVANSTILNNTDGLTLESAYQVNMTNLTISTSTGSGIRIISGSNETKLDNSTIHSNSGNGIDILAGSATSLINSSRIYNNTIGINLSGADLVTVHLSNVTNNTENGIKLDTNSNNTNLTSNELCDNTLSDITNSGSLNNGTLDRCDSWLTWNESTHYGCTYSCSDLWHRFFGYGSGNMSLGDGGANKVFEWLNAPAYNIYFTDSDAVISWGSLEPIGRTTSNTSATDDFIKLDTALNTVSYKDNISFTYSSDGSAPKETTTFRIFGRSLNPVPFANSTISNNTAFTTGILWDASDGGTEYSNVTKQSLVWVVRASPTKADAYGTYDYLGQIPFTLSTYEAGTDTISVYLELGE